MLLKEDALVIKVKEEILKKRLHSAAAYVQHAVKCQVTSQKVSSTPQLRELVTAAYIQLCFLCFSPFPHMGAETGTLAWNSFWFHHFNR